MMDIKEIIKWFIPCFHILRLCKKIKMDSKLTFVFLILLFNLCAPCFGAEVSDKKNSSFMIAKDRILVRFKRSDFKVSQSDEGDSNLGAKLSEWIPRSWAAIGRTFGRPFIKKAIAGLIPLSFQLGAASTWAVVAALVGFKTLLLVGAVLKLLLIAGAAKLGAFFSSKPHHEPHDWEPQKQIHLHIHNGHDTHDDHLSASPWSRIGQQGIDVSASALEALQLAARATTPPPPQPLQPLHGYLLATAPPNSILQALQAYIATTTPAPAMLQLLQPANLLQLLQSQSAAIPPVGPQTISTPFGTYLKIDRGPSAASK